VTRTGNAILARPDLVLEVGDVVHVAGTPAALATLRRAFEPAAGGER
jgi:Trk K+ transport system NAD-binding subunit